MRKIDSEKWDGLFSFNHWDENIKIVPDMIMEMQKEGMSVQIIRDGLQLINLIILPFSKKMLSEKIVDFKWSPLWVDTPYGSIFEHYIEYIQEDGDIWKNKRLLSPYPEEHWHQRDTNLLIRRFCETDHVFLAFNDGSKIIFNKKYKFPNDLKVKLQSIKTKLNNLKVSNDSLFKFGRASLWWKEKSKDEYDFNYYSIGSIKNKEYERDSFAGSGVMGDMSPETSLALINAAKENDLKIVRSVIRRGADLNFQDTDGFTALHLACLKGDEQMVETLVSSMASVNITTNSNRTPLWIASENGHFNIVEILLKRNANVKPKSQVAGKDHTALYIARKNGHKNIEKIIIEQSPYESLQDLSGNCYQFEKEIIYNKKIQDKESLENLLSDIYEFGPYIKEDLFRKDIIRLLSLLKVFNGFENQSSVLKAWDSMEFQKIEKMKMLKDYELKSNIKMLSNEKFKKDK